MGDLLDQVRKTVTASVSPLRFETTGGDNWPVWDRFLSVNGVKTYHLGNICGTCAFLFKRLDGATAAGADLGTLTSLLAGGFAKLDSDVVEALGQLAPEGDYRVILLRFQPERVQPGGVRDYFAVEQVGMIGVDPYQGHPHDPQVAYYRRSDRPSLDLSGHNAMLFDFVAPMSTTLDEGRVEHYADRLAGGDRPTAVALSILETKRPEVDEDGPDHWCMTHYLLDGHHKCAAAARTGLPITLIAFVAVGRGSASSDEVDAAIAAYEG